MERTRTHRQWSPLARALLATGDRWALLIVLALGSGPLRLNQLKAELTGISTGVLEDHIGQMVALGLLTRERFREVPPRVLLDLTDCGRELLPIAGALARWGMRNQWSEPAESEGVEVAALLAQLPVLLEEADLPAGKLESVRVSPTGRVRTCFHVEGGRLQALAEPVDDSTVCIEGDEQAWIAALGPAQDYCRLEFKGDRRLAELVLDALPGRSRS
jgi:DNA-binding HxlR family transcriptional regulator